MTLEITQADTEAILRLASAKPEAVSAMARVMQEMILKIDQLEQRVGRLEIENQALASRPAVERVGE